MDWNATKDRIWNIAWEFAFELVLTIALVAAAASFGLLWRVIDRGLLFAAGPKLVPVGWASIILIALAAIATYLVRRTHAARRDNRQG